MNLLSTKHQVRRLFDNNEEIYQLIVSPFFVISFIFVFKNSILMKFQIRIILIWNWNRVTKHFGI